jgi:hypothetical protein
MRRLLPAVVFSLFTVLALVACAPRATTPVNETEGMEGRTGDGQQDAVVDGAAFIWRTDSDCTPCHGKETGSFTNTQMLASMHTVVQSDCTTCHTDTDAVGAAHAGVLLGDTKGASVLKKTVVTESACSSCHDQGTITSAAAASTILTDSEGTVVNPHALPDIPDHADITCVNCHAVHKSTGLEKTASRTCDSCHHAKVYIPCDTCHE